MAASKDDILDPTARPAGWLSTLCISVERLSSGYQAIGLRSRKKPPVGPSPGSVASQVTVSAPCSTDRGALAPPISVRTHPGLIELT